jgi:hypothetical protein
MSNRREGTRDRTNSRTESKAQDGDADSPTKVGRGASRRPGLGKKTFTYDQDSNQSPTPGMHGGFGGAGGSVALNKLTPDAWNNIPLPLVEGIKTII